MALQGTLDTFALPDVLRLLASARKTGRLRVQGDRGDGSLWFEGGTVVSSQASGVAADSTDGEVVFELLRYGDGSFTFDIGSPAEEPHTPSEVEPLLGDAEHLLAEWLEIEAVVPSMDSWVTLSDELPEREVLVDAASWRIITSIGSGTTARDLGVVLHRSDVEVCRAIRDFVQLGLGAIAELPVVDAAPVVEPAPVVEVARVVEAVPVVVTAPVGATTDFGPFEPTPLSDAPPVQPVKRARPLNGRSPKAGPITLPPPPKPRSRPTEADDVDRQLASLSPKAARAVAAAARAETSAEPDAATAGATGSEDEPLNRDLLLKFLSTVRS